METASKTSSGTGRSKEAREPQAKERAMSDCVSLPSYAEYPSTRPFIRIQLPQSQAHRPIRAFPESSNAAILSALMNLQEKIRKLELERTQAEQNLQRFSRETSRSRNLLETERRPSEEGRPQSRDLVCQLAAAESRCGLLEKQLDYMRKMVRSAETDRTAVLKQQVSLEKDQAQDHADVQAKFQKLDMLEKEYLRLTETQNLAEAKIRELERKLQEEEHQRKLVQDQAAQLQTGLEANRILLQSVSPRPPKVSKSKKKKGTTKKPLQQQSDTHPHYRLSLGDVPFVAGTSTGTSHSVRANVQHVLHLMKQHNRQLCNERVLGDTPLAGASINGRKQEEGHSSSSSSSSGSEELSDLLLALQDEFGHISFEHQELGKQIQACRSDRLRQDLEKEMEAIVRRMENKGEQIGKVRRHQAQLEKLRKEAQSCKRGSGQVRVTTTVSPRGGAGGGAGRPKAGSPGGRGRDSLRLLQDMRTLQTSLRTHQLSWDY